MLHGLTGHAWNTFAGSDRSHEGFKVSCWLRDELPMFLEDQDDKNLHPRVMTFGYNANIWTNATIDGIDAPVSDLVHSLKLERQQVFWLLTYLTGRMCPDCGVRIQTGP